MCGSWRCRRGIAGRAVIHTEVALDSLPVSSRVGWPRCTQQGVALLRRVFIDAVGLGLEQGGFPGFLLRLFLIRVTC